MKTIPLKIRIIICILFILGIPAYIFINIFIDIHKSNVRTVYTTPVEYIALFKPILQDSLKTMMTDESKTRSPLSKVSFSNDTFKVIVCRISLKYTQSLPLIASVKHSLQKKTMNIAYYRHNSAYFKLDYIAGVPTIGDELIIGYDGKEIKPIVQNDSTIIYDAEIKTLSIKYGKDHPIDFYLYSKRRTSESIQTPLNIGFIRRNNGMYLLILCKSDNSKIKQHEQLQSLLN